MATTPKSSASRCVTSFVVASLLVSSSPTRAVEAIMVYVCPTVLMSTVSVKVYVAVSPEAMVPVKVSTTGVPPSTT